jgi:hypothetical protein
LRYIETMKTSQLPPVRVTPAVRQEIEGALREGESLSEFVEASALQAARQRQAQQAFLARGRSSLARARAMGGLVPLRDALDRMDERLDERVAAAREPRKSRSTAHKP